MCLSCFQPLNLCDIEEVVSVLVSKEDEISQKVDIELRDPEKEVRTNNNVFAEQSNGDTKSLKNKQKEDKLVPKD